MPVTNQTAKNVQIPGPVKIWIANPWSSTDPLEELGESTDAVDVQEVTFWHNVPGDANGGQQGPPIDVQILGKIHRVSLDLSRWDPDVAEKLREHSLATVGEVDALEVGRLMFDVHAPRICIIPTNAAYVRNYWCALIREPIGYGVSSKWSALQFQFEGHRPPANHAKEGIIYDTDTGNYTP